MVDSEWFCCYPRPLVCKHDIGKDFDGNGIEELLQSYGVKTINDSEEFSSKRYAQKNAFDNSQNAPNTRNKNLRRIYD